MPCGLIPRAPLNSRSGPMNAPPPKLEEFLSGGDLRSTGTADQAARALLSGRWTPEDFLRLIEKAAPVVRMRARKLAGRDRA